MEQSKKKELLRAIKYTCIAASAGAVQLGSNAILLAIWPESEYPYLAVLWYTIALILSVIWNLTINRKYTFKSASNIKKAIWLTVAFYAVFTPLSLLLNGWLSTGIIIIKNWTIPSLGWPSMVGTVICMVLNLGFEYPFQRYVVFKDSIDSNVKKEEKHD